MARSTAFNSRRPLTAPFGYLSTAQYKNCQEVCALEIIISHEDAAGPNRNALLARVGLAICQSTKDLVYDFAQTA
jgi:hypothetical protein